MVFIYPAASTVQNILLSIQLLVKKDFFNQSSFYIHYDLLIQLSVKDALFTSIQHIHTCT